MAAQKLMHILDFRGSVMHKYRQVPSSYYTSERQNIKGQILKQQNSTNYQLLKGEKLKK